MVRGELDADDLFLLRLPTLSLCRLNNVPAGRKDGDAFDNKLALEDFFVSLSIFGQSWTEHNQSACVLERAE